MLDDLLDRREFGSALAISHHNLTNPGAAAASGDTAGDCRDSTAIGAAVDMIVSVSRSNTPRSRRLTSSGRWPADPLTVALEPGAGFEPAPDLEEAEQDRAGRPLAERVLLHLLGCDPQVRPPARTLADALDCADRRYPNLRAALDELLDAGRIGHGQRPGTPRRKDRGYALTSDGRTRAEALRAQCVISVRQWKVT